MRIVIYQPYTRNRGYTLKVSNTNLTPLERQTHPEEMLVVKRYYSKFRYKFQRRRSWFQNTSVLDDMSKVKSQIVEHMYIASYQGSSVHGNAKQTTQDYVRTTTITTTKTHHKRSFRTQHKTKINYAKE